MPRAKANPDPHIESYVPSRGAGAGRTYEIRAKRTGTAELYLDGVLFKVLADPLHTAGGFAINRYPSNRLQREALERARAYLEGLVSAQG